MKPTGDEWTALGMLDKSTRSSYFRTCEVCVMHRKYLVKGPKTSKIFRKPEIFWVLPHCCYLAWSTPAGKMVQQPSPKVMVELIEKICQLESLEILQDEMRNAGSIVHRFMWRQVFAAGRLTIIYARHSHLDPINDLTKLMDEEEYRILLKGFCNFERINFSQYSKLAMTLPQEGKLSEWE